MCIEKAKRMSSYKENFKENFCSGFKRRAKAFKSVICEHSERAGAKCGHRGVEECTEAGTYPNAHTKTIHIRHTYKAYSKRQITKEGMCD